MKNNIIQNDEKEINKKSFSKSSIITITAIITTLVILSINLILFFSLKKDLTIVFYDSKIVEIEEIPSSKKEYMCCYFRLNSKNSHTLQVQDFQIDNGKNYEKAIWIEYGNKRIYNQFETYVNQPILIVYFNIPDGLEEDTIILTKYKDITMRIGEFAKER